MARLLSYRPNIIINTEGPAKGPQQLPGCICQGALPMNTIAIYVCALLASGALAGMLALAANPRVSLSQFAAGVSSGVAACGIALMLLHGGA